MIYESFKKFKTKLLKIFSHEMIHCIYRINQYTADIYFMCERYIRCERIWKKY